MKKMKIGCIVFGHHHSNTKEVTGSGNLDLSDCRKTDLPVDETVLQKIRAWIEPSIPEETEFFLIHVTSENQAIDVEDADLYVAVPFKQSDIVYSALYSKNKPIVFAVPPYEQIWSYGAVFYPYFVRDARKIDNYLGLKSKVYISKNAEDLKNIIHALQIKFRLNNTNVMCVGEPMYEPFHSWNWGYEMVRALQEKFGVKWKHISSDKFLEIFNGWNKNFKRNLIGKEAKCDYSPKTQDTYNAEKLYFVFKELIDEYDINAFTVNCLASIVHTKCDATACYALSRLNDEGIISACEADITTLLNMLIAAYSSNAPAFMLNPYLFPEDNKLFVSHCTSPRRHSFGSDKTDDVNVYSYFEDPTLSCGLQVLKSPGPVTVTGISHDSMDKMIVIKGEIVRNTAFSSCRTQMEIDVNGDIKEIAQNYQGRHWALVYGDQAEKIKLSNEILGIESYIF